MVKSFRNEVVRFLPLNWVIMEELWNYNEDVVLFYSYSLDFCVLTKSLLESD
jgi:hypothetical protein